MHEDGLAGLLIRFGCIGRLERQGRILTIGTAGQVVVNRGRAEVGESAYLGDAGGFDGVDEAEHVDGKVLRRRALADAGRGAIDDAIHLVLSGDGRCLVGVRDVDLLGEDALVQLILPEVGNPPGAVPGDHDVFASVEQAPDDVYADESHATGYENHSFCPRA